MDLSKRTIRNKFQGHTTEQEVSHKAEREFGEL